MTEWSVFAPSGERVASLSIPLQKVLDIGRDYVLGVALDTDAVETVRELRLRRGRQGLRSASRGAGTTPRP